LEAGTFTTFWNCRKSSGPLTGAGLSEVFGPYINFMGPLDLATFPLKSTNKLAESWLYEAGTQLQPVNIFRAQQAQRLASFGRVATSTGGVAGAATPVLLSAPIP
jgi:hypothetical protein